MAARRALGTNLILDRVMQYFYNDTGNFQRMAPMLVNSDWFDAAGRHYFSKYHLDAEDLRKIVRNEGQDRAQIYANFIRTIPYAIDYHSPELQILQYPSLKSIAHEQAACAHDEWDCEDAHFNGHCISHLLQRQLQVISWDTIGSATGLWEVVRRNCPNIQTLTYKVEQNEIHAWGKDIVDSAPFNPTVSGAFVRFLSAALHLQHLELGAVREVWSEDVLRAIFAKKKLVSLELQGYAEYISFELLQDILTIIEEPLMGLRTLIIDVQPDIVEFIASHLQFLTRLDLLLTGDNFHPQHLVALSNLNNLEALRLGVDDSHEVTLTDWSLRILASNCSRLRWLYLPWWVHRPHFLAQNDISDATIEHIAKSLPELNSLRLWAKPANITEGSILSLLEHCQGLKNLQLSGQFQLDVLGLQQRSFLRLSKIALCGSDPQQENSDNIIELDEPFEMGIPLPVDFAFELVVDELARLFPLCKTFDTNYGRVVLNEWDDLGVAITERCRQLRGQPSLGSAADDDDDYGEKED